MLQVEKLWFHMHDGVLVPEDDTSFALRLTRYCARNNVAVDRLEYAPTANTANRLTYRSDKVDGPTARHRDAGPAGVLTRANARLC